MAAGYDCCFPFLNIHMSECQNFTKEFKRTVEVIVLNMLFSADVQVSAGGCRCLVSGSAAKCFNE